MNVGDLKTTIKDLPDELEVFLVVHNPCGNIELAGSAEESTYGFFGKSTPCLIIEPFKDKEE